MAADIKELNIKPGDTVRVWQKIKEGDLSRKGGAEADKIRLQALEGIVIARKHGSESGATFIIRKMFGDIGVEHIFPLFSPNIDKIEILSQPKMKRAKLYYIREKAAKEIRKKMRQAKAEGKTARMLKSEDRPA